MDEDEHAFRHNRRHHIICFMALFISIILTATSSLMESMYVKQPHHTLALSGEAWVMELLAGHPLRIHTELGVRHNVFEALITTMQNLGMANSQHVSLEESLSIFLYASVTGLSVRHLGERFQRSNDTISRCVIVKLCILTLTQ